MLKARQFPSCGISVLNFKIYHNGPKKFNNNRSFASLSHFGALTKNKTFAIVSFGMFTRKEFLPTTGTNIVL